MNSNAVVLQEYGAVGVSYADLDLNKWCTYFRVVILNALEANFLILYASGLDLF